MSAGIRRRRHWRQRFDPNLRLIFRRPLRIGVTDFKVGEPLPEGLDVRLLRRWWNAHRIELEDFTPPEREISREGKIARAVEKLNPRNLSLYTSTGLPRVDALEKILGFDISMAERTAAHEAVEAKRAKAAV